MDIKFKVLNKRQGKILTTYMNYLLQKAFDLTDGDQKDNQKFMDYHKVIRGIISQSNLYTEQPDISECDLIHEWVFMTPNLMFHSFNGFLAGLGCNDEKNNQELMNNTFNTLKGLSDIANNTNLEPNFIDYD
jgi:hypothetical protein